MTETIPDPPPPEDAGLSEFGRAEGVSFSERIKNMLDARKDSVSETCGTCRFWVKDAPPKFRGVLASKNGECRRYPPSPAIFSFHFPRTSPEQWCGEHRLPQEEL